MASITIRNLDEALKPQIARAAAHRNRSMEDEVRDILRTVLAFEAFAVVLAIGGRNFPVLVSEAYNWQHFNQDTGVAATYAIVVMVISLAATLVYLVVLRTPAEQRG